MNINSVFRGLLSGVLTGVLFLCLFLPVEAEEQDYSLFFGLLHAHTDVSGAEGTAEEAFREASGVEGLDFFAVTDFSHSHDNDESGEIARDGAEVSEDWAAGKAAAEAATSESFVALYGYEMGFVDNSNFGHITTFRTPGFISRNREGFDTLTAYYDALTTVPGSVSQFNHPDNKNGYFQNFLRRTDAYDAAISLVEIGSSQGINDAQYKKYIKALEQGWHVGPTLSQTNFHGDFGTKSDVRTVLLAEELTEDSLYDAMANRRCYATEDADLEIRYHLNGGVMGSIVPLADTLTITVSVKDPTDGSGGKLEIMNGEKKALTTVTIQSEEPVSIDLPPVAGYYFLRFTQSDGDAAVTAPVWVDDTLPLPSNPVEPESSEPESSETESSEPESSETESSEPESSEPEESQPEESQPPEDPMEKLDIRFCFGLLHGHTGLSDGKGTPEEAYAAAANRENMDFYALTEHSNSFDNDLSVTIAEDAAAISQIWARCKAAARNATTSDFVGIFGYEMTWPDSRGLGHITTFATPGFLSRNREDMQELEDYYEVLTIVPGSVSQFCHPGPQTGEFENFGGRTADYDKAMTQLEVSGEKGVEYYIRALDAGWHVSPTASHNDHEGNFGSLNDCRTVILARELTENALYVAMAQRQTYATEDSDLKIYYTLDGHLMGGILPAGENHALRLLVSDPTDCPGTRVEVITDGGEALLSCPMPESGELNLTVPGGKSYYFLRLTQADGDTAVTAPVWTETYDDIGITSLSSDTQVPLPGQRVQLDLTLYNEETLPFSVSSLKLLAEGEKVYSMEYPGLVEPGKMRTFSIPYTQDTAGAVTLTAVVTGTAGGQSHTFRQELTLHFRAKEMVKGILIRLDHSGLDAGDFDNLAVLAADANMTVTGFTGSLPENGSILLLPPPEKAYDAEFLQQVKIFCARGGTLVVCGCHQEDSMAVQYQNRLLGIVGSTMTLRADTALDAVHNGGTPDEIYPTVFNEAADLCGEITEEQFYVHLSGATVEPGQGTWLVWGGKTTVSSLTGETAPVLLAWEELSTGGRVLAAGSLFPGDTSMELPKNRWDAPSANQTILDTLLGITREKFPITPIAQVRRGRKGSLYHIKGFTTSSTSNRYNTFPDTLYLQDDTGGIAVMPFRETGISVGTPMVIAGYLEKDENGNRILRPVDYDFPEERAYRYVPQTMNSSRLTDYDTYGGQLVQAEAEVTALTLTEDGLGVSRFTLTDAWGDSITVLIEDTIFSGAYGTNTLAEEVQIGRNVRAMGLLHLDENRIPVIRVRNCEEVVWVPPVPHPDAKERTRNPYTGDRVGIWATSLTISGLSLHHIRRRKKRRYFRKKVDEGCDI